jgi:hypothetical protein
MVLDEVRETERSVRLLDLFGGSEVAREKGVFRVVCDDGVLWEMELAGGWKREADRLTEFDRPPKHKVRVYGEPSYLLTREAVFADGTKVALYEMSVEYGDVDAKAVLKEAGVHNLSRLEEEYGVERFVRAFAGARDRTMRRWVVYATDGTVMGEQRASAVLGETLFENAVGLLVEAGKGTPGLEYHRLATEPLAAKVREWTKGLVGCTYWDDGTCVEFARLVEGQDEGTRKLVCGSREAFQDFICGCRMGDGGADEVRRFVESRAYPKES